MGRMNVRATVPASVVWHDLECGGYVADLALWRDLATVAGGPVLDLGCGTGRVALDLAAASLDVTACDIDPVLVAEVRARAGPGRVRAVCTDVRELEVGGAYALAIAPMQLVQLLGGRDGRADMLAAVRRHLRPGGVLACALVDPPPCIDEPAAGPARVPVRAIDGDVYASRPLHVRANADRLAVELRRSIVSADRGAARDETVEINLDRITAAELEAEAAAQGYAARPRRHIPPTESQMGSVVAILEAT